MTPTTISVLIVAAIVLPTVVLIVEIDWLENTLGVGNLIAWSALPGLLAAVLFARAVQPTVELFGGDAWADLPPPLNLSTDSPDAPRRVIADRYEVVSVIGQGSAARTLLCSDLRTEGRVVVKELHVAHLTDWKHLELFEREAKMLGRLDYPGIPRVFDYFQGEGESAAFYIVQEYIEARVNNGRTNPRSRPGGQPSHNF
jgi:hypothetical protein